MSLGVDRLVANLPLNEKTLWVPATLGLSPGVFHDYASRILELAIDGKVEALATHRSPETNLWDAISFARLR